MTSVDLKAALQQAVGFLNTGRIAEAKRLCSDIVTRHKRCHQALAILGQIASMSSRHQEAVKRLTRCVSLAPAEIDYHVLLAESLATQGRLRDALARYDKALALRADYSPALAGKANVLARTKAWDAARSLLEPHVDAGTEDAAIALAYARVAIHDGDDERAVEVAARHVDDPVNNEIRRSLWFEIGRAHETGGRFDDAFAAWTQGNELGAAPWDPVESTLRHDRIITTYTTETMTRLPVSGNASPLPVFVVGMPRSGSTLIEQIIDAHPQAHGAGEILLMPDLVRSMSKRIGSTEPYPACVADLSQADVDGLSKSYLDGLRALAPWASRVCDKYLSNYEFLGLIVRMLPGARIIHSRRNGLDTCLSCYQQKFAPAVPGYSENLRHLGMLYNDYRAVMDHWRRTLDTEILEIDYEKLVADQAAVSRRIIDFIDLPWDDRCLRFWASKREVITMSREQVDRPIYKTSVRRHERYAKHLEPLREVIEEGLRGE